MKILSTLFIIAFTASWSISQNIKVKDLSVMYLKPPSEKVQIERTYMWIVKEEGFSQQRAVGWYESGSRSYDARQTYFASGNMDKFGGLEHIKYIPGLRANGKDFSYIEAYFGPTKTIEKKSFAKGSAKNADGTPTKAWHIKVTVDVPKYLKMYYVKVNGVKGEHEFDQLKMREKGEEKYYPMCNDYLINDEDLNGENPVSFNYPDDFNKSLKFNSESAANSGLNKDWPAFEKQVRKQIINGFILKNRRVIQGKYSDYRNLVHIEAYSLKDKEGNYPEFTKWLENFKAIEAEIKKEDEAKSKMNWHSPACKKIVSETLSSVESFIQSKSDAPVHVHTAARMNRMWLYFMNNDFDKAIAENKALTQLQTDLETELKDAKKNKQKIDKTRKKSMTAAIEAIKYNHMDEALEVIEDYKVRFEVNADKLGWK